PVGLPTDILTVNDLFVLSNATTASDAKLLDWSHVNLVSTTGLANLNDQTSFAVGGSLTLNLQSFVLVSGTFTIAKSQVSNVALGNGELLASGTLLTFNVTGATLFAGVGGQFLAGVIDPTAGIGLLASGVAIDLAVLRPVVPDGRTWTGITARATSVALRGLPSDSFELKVSDLFVRMNNAPTGKPGLNWSAISAVNGTE